MPAFLDVPVNAAYQLVNGIATTIEPLTGPYAAAVAIVLCTLAVRLLLLPLSLAAIRGEKFGAALAQLPFVWVMYSLFTTTVVAGHTNQLLAGSLFGAPLGVHWPLFASTPAYLGLAVLLAVVASFSSRRQVRQVDEKASPMVRTLARFLPFGTLATAAFVPLAAGLYLLTTTAWTLLERIVLHR